MDGLTTAAESPSIPTNHLQFKVCQIAIVSWKVGMGIYLI